MAISKEKKQQIVATLVEEFQKAQGVIFTDYRGLTVSEMNQLRVRLREKGTPFRVAKNTLTRLALQQVGLPVPDEYLRGPTAIAFLRDDVAEPVKVLVDFAKETKILEIKGGLLGTQLVDAEAVNELTKLPSRQELLGQVLSLIHGPPAQLTQMIQAPATELVQTLEAPLTELVMTLQAYADKLKAAA